MKAISTYLPEPEKKSIFPFYPVSLLLLNFAGRGCRVAEGIEKEFDYLSPSQIQASHAACVALVSPE